ncbi:MAG: DEAD/DEAH box helicase [Muribaculaceae bacterium]|nr:DEAD/DEAH box helicase [Muribaculaceae bacterium]
MKSKSTKYRTDTTDTRPRVSTAHCPEGMSLREWQLALRRQSAEQGSFVVSELSDRWSPGQYTVGSGRSSRSYRTVYHGVGSDSNYCECMDFRTNNLGTCKHLEAVGLWLERSGKKPVTTLPRRSSLYMSYVGGRRLKLRPGTDAPEALLMAAMRYFDDDMTAVPGMVPELPVFIEQARRLDPQFHCYPDALNYIIEERDRRARGELLSGISDEEIAGVLSTPLYPYQVEGVRFAFGAGRALIADEMGLGKTVQAIATAELMRRRSMIATVLIVCPTSLKYQWKKEIERFTGSSATVIEGVHTRRRALYGEADFYKIVSYHTLANDIRTIGSLACDLLIMDEVQRLKNWNTQISQAARRIDSDYCVVLSGTPLENKLEELYSVMQFVDQYALGPYYEFIDRHVVSTDTGKVTGYRSLSEVAGRIRGCMIRRRKADVALQLPGRTDKVLYVPMTREQRQIHDECRSTVAQLVHKWQRYRFLSEKDRKRLLLLLGRMRMVCDSTFVLDQKTRYGTKTGEALQLVLSMMESGDEKAVIFSQWERMTRILAEEFDRAGIGYEYLHGGVSPAGRRALIERFATEPGKRVLISTDAGCMGLNLQAASLVINLDLPWNPAVLEQRIGRLHRIGQHRPIQVINMVAAATIEERMLGTLDFKSELFSSILDGGDDHITLDDSRLSRIVEAVAELIPEESVASERDEADETSAADGNPEPAELVSRGVKFLTDLASTLRSPEATARLVDSIVHTDAESGRTELRIPVENRAAVTDVITVLAQLFK